VTRHPDGRDGVGGEGLSARVTWLGHATVLIELGPLRVLTDPLLRNRVAHLRRHAPPIEPPGRLDAVLLSHLHRDHADGPSLRRLPPDLPVLVPAGAGRAVERLLGPDRAAARLRAPARGGERPTRRVVEVRAGDRVAVGAGAVTAVPAEHDGRRSPLHPSALSLGFVLEHGARVYFAGDTDIFDGMADLGPIDVALLPIWGWGPSAGPGHLDPESAARALTLLRPRVVIPIHWATYLPVGYSGDHPLLSGPGPAFAARAAELAPDVRVELLRPGTSVGL
jgi:L-ascorbate metabolism protein UlaG (beta-lactamase superfamily)